ncbi:MAG: S8 family serine peptidase [Chitinophagaceae bacterium]|nr:S8 family serine peptidase [Chitinophagaceae bacterium]
MMISISRNTHDWLAVFLLLIIISGCNCNADLPKDWTNYVIRSPYEGVKPDPYQQMIVWLKPGTARADFNSWLQDNIVKTEKNELKIRFVCGSCDSSLFLMEGNGVELFMQGEVARGGSGSRAKPKVTGESGPLYYSTNLPVKYPVMDPIRERIQFPAPPAYSEGEVKVAVFDTGIDTTFIQPEYLYRSSDPSCLSGGDVGWDFADGNSNWADNNPGRHGTTVARLILNEVENNGKGRLSILPVKVFDAEGTSDLYSILCGFAYAQNRKVDIINASFGYYEPLHKFNEDGIESGELSAPVLLKAFIEEYLTKNNILLVAAAGNKDDNMTVEDGFPTDTLQWRNLDSVHFYPASLSAELPNVITITTVYKDLVSPTQNFSPHVVDAGVQADGIDNQGHFYFSNPLDAGADPVAGSSFAAPVATGKTVSWYYLYKDLLASPMSLNTKDSIFQVLQTKPVPAFLFRLSGLEHKVKEGKTFDRERNAGARNHLSSSKR